MSLKDSLFNYTAGKGKSGSGLALLASIISINGRPPFPLLGYGPNLRGKCD